MQGFLHIGLLKRLNNDPRISDATDLFEINVGLVSGENDFFIMNHQMVSEYNLQSSVMPIISRSEQLKGVLLTNEDFNNLVAAGKKVFFFASGNVGTDDLTENQKSYISYGESKDYHRNYKCRIRSRWYSVPLTWEADAFLIRQAHLYPRMILNRKHVLPTLSAGECLIVGDAAPLPAVIKMDMPNPIPNSSNVNVYDEWNKNWIDIAFETVIKRWWKE